MLLKFNWVKLRYRAVDLWRADDVWTVEVVFILSAVIALSSLHQYRRSD
jgi:hypothetical protein